METQLRIEFLTPNVGVSNQLHKTLIYIYIYIYGIYGFSETKFFLRTLTVPIEVVQISISHIRKNDTKVGYSERKNARRVSRIDM